MIREIKHSDFDGLMSLYMQLHSNPFLEKTPEIQQLWNKILSDESYHIIVAEENVKSFPHACAL